MAKIRTTDPKLSLSLITVYLLSKNTSINKSVQQRLSLQHNPSRKVTEKGALARQLGLSL